MNSDCSIYTEVDAHRQLRALVLKHLPPGDYRRIVIKPNWVKHETSPHFPIVALVTSSELIDAVLEACLDKYATAETITVCDVPLQTCDWPALCAQSGINRLMDKYRTLQRPQVRFLDLRRERLLEQDGFFRPDSDPAGDPLGYREVVLDRASFLEPISDERERFRVSDYDPGLTVSSHQRGHHRYLIAGTILDADLLINMPKMKTHQKAGITGALKNLVGINGQKAYLVHYREGTPRQGGDEFPPEVPLPVVLQVRVRDVVQRRSERLFRALRPLWQVARRLWGIETSASGLERLHAKRFYLAGGSWHGNDTIWRMVFDLNKIARYAPRTGGVLQPTPQRDSVVVLDGLIAGEGNGPLQPLPVHTKLLAFGEDPFRLDMAMSRLMGFDRRRIPTLSHFREFADPVWGSFDPDHVEFSVNGERREGVDSLPVVARFAAPPGWRGKIEVDTP